MTDLAHPPTAHGHAPSAGAHDDEPLAHFLSPWPIVSALGAALLLMGIVLHPLLAFLGVIVTFGGVTGWVRQDMRFFVHPPHEELFHHGKAPNPLWGVIVFLGTEVMLFGALFAMYFHARHGAHADGLEWPGVHLPILATGINTLVLMSSGATMHFAQHSIAHGNRRNFKIGLVLTLLLGAAFLGQQIREYIELFLEEFTLSSSIAGSTFYALTGTHGLHVFGGLIAIFVVLVRALRGQFSPERYLLVEGAAFYWHFVDVVWIFLFLVIYLGWI